MERTVRYMGDGVNINRWINGRVVEALLWTLEVSPHGGMETSSWPAQQPLYSPSIGPTAALSARFAALELSLFPWIGGALTRPHSIDCTPTSVQARTPEQCPPLYPYLYLCLHRCWYLYPSSSSALPNQPSPDQAKPDQFKPTSANLSLSAHTLAC